MPKVAFKKEPYRYDFSVPENYVFKAKRGLSEKVVEEISWMKKEPEWMRKSRLRALALFYQKSLPQWGGDLTKIDFNNIFYYLKPTEKQGKTWDDVPADIKKTFDRLGIPEAERKFLAGVTAQFESEAVYHSIQKDLTQQGVIFTDMDTALREYPDIVHKYFGTIIPAHDNKFAALNTAVWSGGSFLYVPKNVHVKIPLQAYFRINAKNMGQFERTLIITEEGASVHYIEGCTAPVYTTDSLHSAVVELIAMPHSTIRYTTIQNWSNSVYNLVTKRAMAHENATVQWIDANIGSKLTMKYPCVVLAGRGAKGEVLSMAFAGNGQHQDAGAKMIHIAPDTSSIITSKSLAQGGGRTSYRGLVKVLKGAERSKVHVQCDALLIDPQSRSDTYPTMDINEEQVAIAHEASVTKITEDQLFYLRSRGLTEADARAVVVGGFVEQFVKELPMEYAVEMNRLIQMEMEGGVG